MYFHHDLEWSSSNFTINCNWLSLSKEQNWHPFVDTNFLCIVNFDIIYFLSLKIWSLNLFFSPITRHQLQWRWRQTAVWRWQPNYWASKRWKTNSSNDQSTTDGFKWREDQHCSPYSLFSVGRCGCRASGVRCEAMQAEKWKPGSLEQQNSVSFS